MNVIFKPVLSMAAGLLLVACASAPPSELVEARNAYTEAASERTASRAPAELKTAEEALARAERAFQDDGNEARTRDYAYIAERRAQIAVAVADRRLVEELKVGYDERRVEVKDALLEQNTAELAASQDRVASERGARIDAEQEARDNAARARAAEAKADAATAKLNEMRASMAKWANLVENERGLVITLSSGVVFTSGKSAVLPAAAAKLSQVADLLQATPGRRVVVEGHTDSAGSDTFNQSLSQQRADAVRTFLIGRGVDADRVSAVGYGESKPATPNDTVEGRATNRRVEIVLEPIPVPSPTVAK